MRKLRLDELARDSVESYQDKPKLPVTIVLDNVRSGHNVGSVCRTCDAFAFQQIILCGITPRPSHKEINKAAIGATLSVQWRYEELVETAIHNLKKDNYFVLGIEQTDDSELLRKTQFPLDRKIALVFGNEVNGISEAILPLLDKSIEIEQYGTKHSFNISVCAGIVMWEINRAFRPQTASID